MGALDFLKEFEGRALDAASYKLLQRNYEMQEENNRLLKDKVERLAGAVADLREQNKKLSEENGRLSEKVMQSEQDKKYKIWEGIAFKLNKDGPVESTPYCPNCHSAMSHHSGLPSYICPKCKYTVRTRTSADVLAREINSHKSNQTDRTNMKS
jgi:ribosomal protein S27AE